MARIEKLPWVFLEPLDVVVAAVAVEVVVAGKIDVTFEQEDIEAMALSLHYYCCWYYCWNNL